MISSLRMDDLDGTHIKLMCGAKFGGGGWIQIVEAHRKAMVLFWLVSHSRPLSMAISKSQEGRIFYVEFTM